MPLRRRRSKQLMASAMGSPLIRQQPLSKAKPKCKNWEIVTTPSTTAHSPSIIANFCQLSSSQRTSSLLCQWSKIRRSEPHRSRHPYSTHSRALVAISNLVMSFASNWAKRTGCSRRCRPYKSSNCSIHSLLVMIRCTSNVQSSTSFWSAKWCNKMDCLWWGSSGTRHRTEWIYKSHHDDFI